MERKFDIFDNRVFATVIDEGIEYRFTIDLLFGKLVRLDCPDHLNYWPTPQEERDIMDQIGKLNF